MIFFRTLLLGFLVATTHLTLCATQQPRLLHLHFKCPDPGGIESHLLGLNKVFTEKGIYNKVMTSYHSTFLINALNQPDQANGASCRIFKTEGFDPVVEDLRDVCTKDNIDVIISNWPGGLEASVNYAAMYPIKLVYMHHNFVHDFSEKDIYNLNQTRGILAVSPLAVSHLKKLADSGQLKVTNIEHMAPFWDEDRYLSYKPKFSKKDFITKELKLSIDEQSPIICSVANLYWYKNHGVLIKALAYIHRTEQIRPHLIIAGDGPERKKLEDLVKNLGLTSYVHMIGKTLEVPELLYHANLHVLPSSHESFGLVHLEAATMKKPFIGATQTGAEGFIQDGVTGFIFESNNMLSLGQKLSLLLNNPTLTKYMGEQAYKFVRKTYANKVIFEKWLTFLGTI